MSRATMSKTKLYVAYGAIVLIVLSMAALAYNANATSHKVTSVVNAQHQTTQLSYQGQDGKNALVLLKEKATVQTKHYSFGDLVVSINGSAGNGPKYWTLYVNNKEATVGAGAYVTKNGDTITWKLQ